MQMTFMNTDGILTKLSLNGEVDFFPSYLETGLTHCSTTEWPAANTSLKFGLISGKFCCCLVVRDFLYIEADNSTCDIFEAKQLVFDRIALADDICNIDMNNKQLLRIRKAVFDEVEQLKQRKKKLDTDKLWKLFWGAADNDCDKYAPSSSFP